MVCTCAFAFQCSIYITVYYMYDRAVHIGKYNNCQNNHGVERQSLSLYSVCCASRYICKMGKRFFANSLRILPTKRVLGYWIRASVNFIRKSLTLTKILNVVRFNLVACPVFRITCPSLQYVASYVTVRINAMTTR